MIADNEENLNNFEPFELFQKELEEYLEEYILDLSHKFKSATVQKHSIILSSFIEYVTTYHGCTELNQITKGMCGAKFTSHLHSEQDDFFQTVTIKNSIIAFFDFIYQNHDVRNIILMKALTKK